MEYYLNPNDPRFMSDTDSSSIQRAVDAAENSNCRTVIIPRRCERTGCDEWIIDKTILLPSDITIILDDCHLTLAEGVYENIFRNKNMYTDISLKPEGKQHRIRITGRGGAVLDGGKGNDLRESTSQKDGRPHVRYNNFILLHNVYDYVLENFRCVNMRWWAINQMFCKFGRLSNLSFFNGNIIPNQDGINCRMGCSHITIENITGRTGDDVVALSAFPGLIFDKLMPEDGDVDIHDIIIRNVNANTRQSVVALRNTDGAKMYRITIENISDSGGEYRPWGVVRIGENNYFRDRTSVLGETYDITVRGVRSLARGTVYLAETLKDSHISDVYAGGTAMYAVSTYRENGGVTLENVVIDNIHYNAVPIDEDKTTVYINDGDTSYNGCAVDFRRMGENDTLSRVVFRDIFTCEGAELSLVNERYKLDIRN